MGNTSRPDQIFEDKAFPSFVKQKRRNRKPVSRSYLKCRLLNSSVFRRTNTICMWE